MQANGFHKFEDLFEKATHKKPYPYQIKLAEEGIEIPSVINIPTGMGKTSAIVLAWLWRRIYHYDENVRNNTPRRLIYCLPMRVLVEQTKESIIEWLKNLDILGAETNDEDTPKFDDQQKIPVVMLMAGEDSTEWDIYPERNMIIVGTQDMLLSREINRGYGMSKYRWPLHFGLLNNDTLWVMDEIQLMGSGLKTSLQMEQFRKKRGNMIKSETVWMSATLNREWLNTIDFRFDQEVCVDKIISLQESDMKNDNVSKLINSDKILSRIEASFGEFDKIVENVLHFHVSGTTTIVIMNTVDRAQKLYKEMKKVAGNKRIILLHSQFRPPDRKKIVDEITREKQGGNEDRIIISTQVIEAGVDISSRILFTEVGPWASMVQRFGRCNRYGEYDKANVFWIDYGDDAIKYSAPYSSESISFSRKELEEIDGKSVSPGYLENLQINMEVDDEYDVIRFKDILELFDTTVDVIGSDIDVSRFVRDTKDTHVYVFWREYKDETSLDQEMLPDRDELCPAPINDVKKLIKKEDARVWDYYEGRWVILTDSQKIFPGMEVMLRSSSGYYNSEIGWDTKSRKTVPLIVKKRDNKESYEDNNMSIVENEWKTLSDHTDEVVKLANKICSNFQIGDFCDVIEKAVRWHDYGKAHPEFQAKIDKKEKGREYIAAKAPKNSWNRERGRKYFRHELVSGLVALKILQGKRDGYASLIAYLAASHHGKVRMSIRSLPDEVFPADENKKFARGVWDGDIIPEVDLGGGLIVPETRIDLSPMDMGKDSWLSKMMSLCNDKEIGIFRLGFMEAIVKAADERASRGV